MAIQFNHTIVWSSNQSASAKFLAEMLGRPVLSRIGHFDVVKLDNGVVVLRPDRAVGVGKVERDMLLKSTVCLRPGRNQSPTPHKRRGFRRKARGAEQFGQSRVVDTAASALSSIALGGRAPGTHPQTISIGRCRP
jgi:hypothetical protein